MLFCTPLYQSVHGQLVGHSIGIYRDEALKHSRCCRGLKQHLTLIRMFRSTATVEAPSFRMEHRPSSQVDRVLRKA